jgi:crotonobetainyl-CoA:carnitine CoA-transferase CaiB-like acyl-CoA transferase
MTYIGGTEIPFEEATPDAPQRGAQRPGPTFARTPWASLGAMYSATLGIVAAIRARECTGKGQHVATSLLQGALGAVALNWQRVERHDEMYWMWPVDARSVEGLFECSDGRWVHHWTVRPRWVLAAAAGDSLVENPLDTAYRDDPDRIPMDPAGLLAVLAFQPLLAEAFAKFPSDQWVKAGAAAGVGVALVRTPEEALRDPRFLADGCVVVVNDPEVGAIRHVGPVIEFSATPSRVRGPSPRVGEHTDDVLAEAAVTTSPPAAREPTQPKLPHPLAGIRVLDMGLGVAGPYTGRALADLGADVIKVNALHDKFWSATHMGLGTNRGKRSIAIDLKNPRGREVLERLLSTADVFTTNWRPGAAARLGLDYETLHARYPRLVYCNTRGYEKGARSDLPGTDQTASALTGSEWEDSAAGTGNPPVWSRSSMGDTGNALLAAIGITAALGLRERTGDGQSVATSIVNACLLQTAYAWIPDTGPAPDWGHVDAGQYGLSPYYRIYHCAGDTWLCVAALAPAHRIALITTLGQADVTTDAVDLKPDSLEHAFSSRSASVWFADLDDAGVPVEVVDETFARTVFDSPTARDAQLVATTSNGYVGRFEDPGLLVNFSETPGVIQRGSCGAGEHSRELLLESGYSPGEVDELVTVNAILDAPFADQ